MAGWAPRPASQRQASLVFNNLVSLGVVALGPRLVPGTTRGSGPAWHADVAVSWRPEGARAATADSSMVYGFVDSGARTLVASVAPAPGARLPIWLVPGLHVRRGTRTLVAAGSAVSARRVGRLLDDAVVAVGAVLPHWRGGLVAYAPATARQFGRLIATPPDRYAGIAAVTTSIDGSDAAPAPLAIVVSPRVFASLGPLGAHVVITHEATHVATRAAAADMPLWVAEGFADYVGIGSVDVAVPVAAQAALSVVRRQGAPAQLPDDAAFAVGSSGLEATYEEAWLATSLIARRYGRGALVAFYRLVERHPEAIDEAFAAALHTSRASFTAAWRTYLADLARAG